MSDERLPATRKQEVIIARPGETPAPAIIDQAGNAARFAWEEFFQGEIRNEHTRKAYTLAIRRFLEWCEERQVELVRITPGMVGQYFNFRVTTITDLLEQNVPLEEVQYLAGHADSRTTALYDRRSKKVTRNIVERISV
jgi:site-specific recombinase XerD